MKAYRNDVVVSKVAMNAVAEVRKKQVAFVYTIGLNAGGRFAFCAGCGLKVPAPTKGVTE